MRVVILNTYERRGGAAIAANRLHRALLAAGIDSTMVVLYRLSDDRTVVPLFRFGGRWISLFFAALDRFPVLFYRRRTKALFSPGWFSSMAIVKRVRQLDPDIVHLHWVTNGFLRVEQLERLHKPIVWSLHDMWPFTGGCHYSEGCRSFEERCDACPSLGSNARSDLSISLFNRKSISFPRIRKLVVVGLSRWLAEEARRSALFRGREVVNLPNPIDIHQFAPVDRTVARGKFNLSIEKKYLLFGAVKAKEDPRKGFKMLREALQKIAVENLELLVFGAEGDGAELSGFPTHYFGSVSGAEHLAALYSAADFIVVPSLQENLSNIIMESLSCGTPVVAFDIGGNGDMIEHKKNGYLAKEGDPEDLATGIAWGMAEAEKGDHLRRAARESCELKFASDTVAQKYIRLYSSLIQVETQP